MISLDSSSTVARNLQIALAAVPAAELAWVSNYGDNTEDDIALTTQTGLTTNTTAVSIMDSPPEDTNEFQLKTFHIKNQNAAAVTVIVQYNDNATIREIYRVTLNQHDTLQYNQMRGWFVSDSYGNIKVTLRSTDLGIYAQVNPSAATLTDGLTVPDGYYIDGHVVVANRSGTATSLRLSLAPNGAADAVTQYFAYDLAISGNNVYDSAQIIADSLDVIRVYATLATLTFSIFALRRVV